ncbi:transcriptional regulator [Collinsella tanakaei]|uniref:helix-turn-helix transcriptional regulator n=1 Tax=Collinsella tanakaei TaxID=626935 RepID=UPI00195C8524|nr:helix-turn-helix transcriptional regulator [Collinsella tanakaei]MBM6778478.1 transcriptional regulator [Collinsella tanakaei]
MSPAQIEFYRRLAKGLALQFGPNCEIVVHDLEAEDLDHSIVAIENGHVSGRHLGDGPSHVVLEALHDDERGKIEDRPPYLTKTADGKLLKSSTIFIRDDAGWPCGILAINFDITIMTAFSSTLSLLIGTGEQNEPEPIAKNIGDLLDDLFSECEQVVGKPAALMTKEERVRAIGYLDRRGAFLISKSSQKACEFFGISKYSFYSYLDEAKALADSQRDG